LTNGLFARQTLFQNQFGVAFKVEAKSLIEDSLRCL
jgi:hypothetical protein